MHVKITIVSIDLMSVNAWRMIFIDALSPLAGKDMIEILAETISPNLKTAGSVLTVLQNVESILFCM